MDLSSPEELEQGIFALRTLDEERDKANELFNAKVHELKAKGYDVKAMKKVVSDFKKDLNAVVEEELIVDLYRRTIGLKFDK